MFGIVIAGILSRQKWGSMLKKLLPQAEPSVFKRSDRIEARSSSQRACPGLRKLNSFNAASLNLKANTQRPSQIQGETRGVTGFP